MQLRLIIAFLLSEDKRKLIFPRHLILQKAHMLTSAADLIYLLDWEVEQKKTAPIYNTRHHGKCMHDTTLHSQVLKMAGASPSIWKP